MPISRRRRIAFVVIVFFALLAAGLAAGVSAAADKERITGYWVGAVMTEDGLAVTEVIDYDFGPVGRHGIYRDIPDVIASTIRVSSPTAPAQALVSLGFTDTRVRIGDPDVTVNGRHRYRIDYVLPADTVIKDGIFAFDAIGTDWTVPVSNVLIVGSLSSALNSPACSQGTPWSERPCEINSIDSSRFEVRVDSLDSGEGVTVSALIGSELGGAAVPVPPSGPASDPGTGILLPVLTAFIVFGVAALAAGAVTRRAGRERVWLGGAADAAWGEATDGLGSQRMDEKQLAEMATIEFEPPRDLSAVEGGLLVDERTKDQHLSAWLLESAIRDEIRIDGGDDPELHWGTAPAHPGVHPILVKMFSGRESVELGTYDTEFKSGWEMLRGELNDWRHGSAHWDEAGRKRQIRVRWLAVLALLVGAAGIAFGAGLANLNGVLWLYLLALGAIVAGGGLGAMAYSYELLVRTEAASALWLRVESFRRFLANSEARHVDDAAEKGVLRHYTAWAVALGESDAWSEAAEAAAKANPQLRSSYATDLAFITVGHSIGSAARAAATAPSSSGSGGGFSGSVGGGGGGGGGGSW